MASAEPSVGSVPAPTSSSSTSVAGPAASTKRTTLRRWLEKVDSDCAMLCSSPMSAMTRRKTGRRAPSAAGTRSPAWCMSASRPSVLSADRLAAGVRPGDDQGAVAEPIAEAQVDGDGARRPAADGARRAARPRPSDRRRAHGVHPRRRAARVPSTGRLAPGRRELARSDSLRASTSRDSSSRIRSSSRCGASDASVQALLRSTTVSGSMKSVAPDALWSWTMPLTLPLASARIGIT